MATLCCAPFPPPGITVADPLPAINAYYNALAVVIDVRTPAEFANGTMKRATNIPVSMIAQSAASLPADMNALATGPNGSTQGQ